MMIAYRDDLNMITNFKGKYTIYRLLDPFTNEVIYVGQTRHDIATRLTGHISNSSLSNRRKYEYIKSIIDRGGRPIIEAIEQISCLCVIDKAFVDSREIFWIKYYISLGIPLLNAANAHQWACSDYYESYLKDVQAGNPKYSYYYCGRTAYGEEVYDEERMQMDGLLLPEYISDPHLDPKAPYSFPDFINKLFEQAGTIEWPFPWMRPEQVLPMPEWTIDFLVDLPPDELLLDFDIDESDYETVDFDLELEDCDLEDDGD